MMDKIKTFLSAHNKPVIIGTVVLICVIAVICMILIINSTVFTVTFFSDQNSILLVDKVKSNEAAVPPSVPELTYGNIFTKWDTDFSRVTSNLDIRPEYEVVQGKANTFALTGAYGKEGETILVPFVLCGDVKLSGFDAEIEYDPDKLTLDSTFNVDGDVMVNDTVAGKVKLNFVSANNVTADVDICSLKLVPQEGADKDSLTITVKSIYAVDDKGELYVPEFNTIDSTVYIIP